MRRVLVIAGSHAQYEQWIRDNDVSKRSTVYVNSAYAIKGMRGAEYIRIGTWYNRKDANKIAQELLIMGCVETKEPPKVTREEIIDDGINAMVHSMMELIEPCLRQRCSQIMKVLEDTMTARNNDN